MRIEVLQHVPFEGPGSIAAWAAARGAELAVADLYAGAQLPELQSGDLVVVMGGPMSANDDARYPWLAAEKAYLRELIARGVPLLGICLGAQLIAACLGARVYANRCREIGWFPIEAVAAPEGCLALPPRSLVFHWHGETFDLPEGAQHLARSQACDHQAFQYGTRVIGLQFHLETTPASAAELIAHGRAELMPDRFVQDERAIAAAPAAYYAGANALMDRVLDYLLAGRAHGA